VGYGHLGRLLYRLRCFGLACSIASTSSKKKPTTRTALLKVQVCGG
jgi:hypothetical protein